ncbi:MAG: hypothetical protein ACOY3E_00870 [Pseudomonadota bacterium]
MHLEAMRLEATHLEATHLEATHFETMHFEAMHFEAMQPETRRFGITQTGNAAQQKREAQASLWVSGVALSERGR